VAVHAPKEPRLSRAAVIHLKKAMCEHRVPCNSAHDDLPRPSAGGRWRRVRQRCFSARADTVPVIGRLCHRTSQSITTVDAESGRTTGKTTVVLGGCQDQGIECCPLRVATAFRQQICFRCLPPPSLSTGSKPV
jgi:hypothetical protein